MASLTPTSATNGSFEEIFTADTARSVSPATLFAEQLHVNPELLNDLNALKQIFRTFGSGVLEANTAELANFKERQVTVVQGAYEQGIKEGKQLGYQEGEVAGYEAGVEDGKAEALVQKRSAAIAHPEARRAVIEGFDTSTQTDLPSVKTTLGAATQAAVSMEDAGVQALVPSIDNFTQVETKYADAAIETDPMPILAAEESDSKELDESGVSSLAEEIAKVSIRNIETQTDPINRSYLGAVTTVAGAALGALVAGYVAHSCSF